jgi:hemerythrin
MAFIDWRDNYSTGIAKLDNQHRNLLDYLNTLYDAMQAGKGKDALESVFKGLLDYTKTHFAAEEGLMKLYRYPDYEAHKAVHDKLAAHVQDLYRQFQAGTIRSPIQITNFLKDWLQKHILGTDQKYAPFLKDKGVV